MNASCAFLIGSSISLGKDSPSCTQSVSSSFSFDSQMKQEKNVLIHFLNFFNDTGYELETCKVSS